MFIVGPFSRIYIFLNNLHLWFSIKTCYINMTDFEITTTEKALSTITRQWEGIYPVTGQTLDLGGLLHRSGLCVMRKE